MEALDGFTHILQLGEQGSSFLSGSWVPSPSMSPPGLDMTLTTLHLVSEASLGSSEQTLNSGTQRHSFVAPESISVAENATLYTHRSIEWSLAWEDTRSLLSRQNPQILIAAEPR